MPRRPLKTLLPLPLLVAALLGSAQPAGAANGLEVAIQDDAVYAYS